jgi:hypothetical protein
MDISNVSLLKERLRSLQPQTRASALNDQLQGLREELRAARSRGVSFSTLSTELKLAGIAVTPAALSKYLGRRARPKPAAAHEAIPQKLKASGDGQDQRQVNTGENALQLVTDTVPK